MLEGITVLSKKSIDMPPEWTVKIITSGFIMVCISLIILFFRFKSHSKIVVFGETVGLIGVATFLIFGAIASTLEKPTGKYEYQVTIDDSAPFKEIYDKYEVIEVDGEIYTIQDKERD